MIQLEKAVELDPDMPEAQFALGLVYAQLNELDKAISALETFLSIEIPAGCAGDQALAEDAREQAQMILDQLRGQ